MKSCLVLIKLLWMVLTLLLIIGVKTLVSNLFPSKVTISIGSSSPPLVEHATVTSDCKLHTLELGRR